MSGGRVLLERDGELPGPSGPAGEPQRPVGRLEDSIEHVKARFLVSFYLFLLLAVVVPLVLLRSLAVQETGLLEPGLAWLVVAYSGARLSLLAWRGEQKLVSMTFWMFVYIWMGIAPLAQLSRAEFPLGGSYSQGTVALAFGIVLAGLVAFEVGARIQERGAARGSRLGGWLAGRSLSVARTLIIAVAGVAIASYLVLRLGGIDTFLASRRDVFLTIQSAAAGVYRERFFVVAKLLAVPPFLSAYLLWWLWLRRRERLGLHVRAALGFLLVASMLITLLVSNPVNSARYWVGTILLSIAFVTIPWKKSWSFVAWTVTLLLALLLVFPYADVFRTEIDPGRVDFGGVEPLIEKGDYDAFQQLMNAVLYVEDHGVTRGRQAVGTLLSWVPRRLWDDKPLPSGEVVADSMGYGYTNLSMPLWGEAYLDGGLLLVVLAFAGYGFLVGRLERGFLASVGGDENVAGFLVPILAGYQLFLLRGALMSALAYLLPILVLLLLATGPVKRGPRMAHPVRVRARPSRS